MRFICTAFLFLALCFYQEVYAQTNTLYARLVRHFYYPYDGDYCLLEDMKIGVNTAAFVYGGAAEIAAEFRLYRFASICFSQGFTIKQTPYSLAPENYKYKGTLIKFGIRNYLLNGFFPSKLDVFSGIYYIGSSLSEEYFNGNNKTKSYDNYNNFIALQTGLSYRPLRNFALQAGVQYTFLKDRKIYPLATESSYQPGVGRWKQSGAFESVFTLQYRIPVNLWKTTICCIDRKGKYGRCSIYSHKSPKFL